MVDPGEGSGGPTPPLFLDHTEVRRAEIFFLAGGQNFFFLRPPPTPAISQGLDDRSPPLI